jgi:micrococcal nuclease
MKRISSFIIGALFIFLLVFTFVSDPSSIPEVFNLSEGEVLSETVSLITDQTSPTPIPEANGEKETVLVTRVIDGDTIEIEGGQKIRYIGIDTPESKHPSKPIQCFSKEATERNRQLVEGKQIQIEKDVNETDRYGRLLRYVYIDDEMINQKLVAEGFAKASAYPPDVKYQELFNEAQRLAEQQSLGLWGDLCLNS